MNSAPLLSLRPACRFAFLALLSLGGAASSLVAQPAASGPIVELPKFVVTDSRELPPPESWRYAQIPGFEILTSASDRATKSLIRDFGLFKQALEIVFPVPTGASAPTTLILCGRGGKFGSFVPDGKGTNEGVLASLFLNHHEQTAIVIDLQASTLDLVGTDVSGDTTSDPSQISVEHNKLLYREYVHFLLGRSEPRPPAWLEEGMAQIIMAMKFDKKSIYFGQLDDQNAVSAAAGQIATLNALTAFGGVDAADDLPTAGAPIEDRDFNVVLRGRALVPLQEFFTLAHDSPEALNPLGNNRWAKQSYAFVHMCLFGQNGRYQKPFALFLSRLSKQPPSEALFKECFKMSYREMLDELRGYLNVTNYKARELLAKKGGGLDEPPPLVLREATQAEIGRIKGEAFVLAGHPDRARTELTSAYIRGERDPALLAALGIFQHTSGDDERARKLLEAATAAKVSRPAAYLDLAQLRYADALVKPAAAEGTLSDAQVASVQSLLLTARQQVPSLPGVYELLSDLWVHSAAKPKKDDILVLVEGVRLFPTRLKLLYQTALFCLDAGMNDVAGPLIDYGVKIAPDAKGKDAFSKLKMALPSR